MLNKQNSSSAYTTQIQKLNEEISEKNIKITNLNLN